MEKYTTLANDLVAARRSAVTSVEEKRLSSVVEKDEAKRAYIENKELQKQEEQEQKRLEKLRKEVLSTINLARASATEFDIKDTIKVICAAGAAMLLTAVGGLAATGYLTPELGSVANLLMLSATIFASLLTTGWAVVTSSNVVEKSREEKIIIAAEMIETERFIKTAQDLDVEI